MVLPLVSCSDRRRPDSAAGVNQAVETPISAIGLLWMLLLAYLIFTLTLILQRKQAARMLSFGLVTLSVPLAPCTLLLGRHRVAH